MTAIRKVLADSRRVFGSRRVVAELVGGPVLVLLLALVMTGVVVLL